MLLLRAGVRLNSQVLGVDSQVVTLTLPLYYRQDWIIKNVSQLLLLPELSDKEYNLSNCTA